MLESHWLRKRDDEVEEAVTRLHEYTEEAQQVVLAEWRRRGLDEQKVVREEEQSDEGEEAIPGETRTRRRWLVIPIYLATIVAAFLLLGPSLAGWYVGQYVGVTVIALAIAFAITPRGVTEQGLLVRVMIACFGLAFLLVYGQKGEPLVGLRDGAIDLIVTYPILRIVLGYKLTSGKKGVEKSQSTAYRDAKPDASASERGTAQPNTDRAASQIGLAGPDQLNAPASTEASQTELAFWETIRAGCNLAEFQAYLDKYPNGAFAGLARNRLALLATRDRLNEDRGR